jgi:hypothetical protein
MVMLGRRFATASVDPFIRNCAGGIASKVRQAQSEVSFACGIRKSSIRLFADTDSGGSDKLVERLSESSGILRNQKLRRVVRYDIRMCDARLLECRITLDESENLLGMRRLADTQPSGFFLPS